MRLPDLALALVLAASGCDELLGKNDQTARLVLFTADRQLIADGMHTTLLGAEVARGASNPPTAFCAYLTAQLGSFESTGTDLVINDAQADGGTNCGAAHCAILTIPASGRERQFVIYRAGTHTGTESIIGELSTLDDQMTSCPAKRSTLKDVATVSVSLTSSSESAKDMAADVPHDQSPVDGSQGDL